MFSVSRGGVLRVETVKATMRAMALMGLNSYMLYSEDTFEKFAHKTKQKVDKRTSKDLINAERRKKMAEREELAEAELSVVIV